MRKIWNKGHRIRASDKHLVYHFSIGTLLFVFVAVLLLLNIKQLISICKRTGKQLVNIGAYIYYSFTPFVVFSCWY